MGNSSSNIERVDIMERYYCGFCNIFALALNYNNEIPVCMCGQQMNKVGEDE